MVVPSLIEVTSSEAEQAVTDKPADPKKAAPAPKKLVKPVIIGQEKDKRPYIPNAKAEPKVEAHVIPGAQWIHDIGRVPANVVQTATVPAVTVPARTVAAPTIYTATPTPQDNNIYVSHVIYRDEAGAKRPARKFCCTKQPAKPKYRYDIEWYSNWLVKHGKCLDRTTIKSKPKCAAKLKKFWYRVKQDPTVTGEEWKILRRIVERQRIIDKLKNTFRPQYLDEYHHQQTRLNLKLTLKELEEVIFTTLFIVVLMLFTCGYCLSLFGLLVFDNTSS